MRGADRRGVARPPRLTAAEVTPAEVPLRIDELPLVGVLGCLASGRTVVRGARQLRVEESDRIAVLASGLRGLGAAVEEFDDGFAVTGPARLEGAVVDPVGDHRIAMALWVAGLTARGETTLEDPECVAVSWPDFFARMTRTFGMGIGECGMLNAEGIRAGCGLT